ncbi:MAG: threonine--tRNA ligase [Gammaproteobacteria bacterium RIFCSPLOWO2_02_FULL_38_11]|nr:MAG: threonine--tRNA ligase [Gammaproteobacteria bacterium RIFCSPHIGHO2_12_38_15]OGT67631.1 MAG: threonine--tRNA ligase [Gammaproteobacteria bacterium RIFCSPLOWO2_02_FULL_38_11]
MPITLTLPDSSQRHYDAPVPIYKIAQDLSPSLAKCALAGKIKGRLVDTSFIVKENTAIQIITAQDEEGLEILRHSSAHLLAHAVKELFPEAQVTIGPVIENGFYYDFSCKTPFTSEQLSAIEKRMHEIVKRNLPIQRLEWSREKAIAFFKEIGEHYKAEIISAIPNNETLSLYQQGDFIDLCRGPHVPNTKFLKIFKLTKIAGAYWRGDSKNEMLQRIYGTAWTTKEDLEKYLTAQEEAEKRDHRKIAKALDLFHIQEEGPGMVFWHPQGLILYRILENYIREKLTAQGYQEIRTPQILDRSLWEKSGHWEKFHKDMFITESEKHVFAIKPMSCPAHIQVFNQGLKSYRDLPLRFAEFGCCHRNEPSGALHGILRTRAFTQDDGHVFCTEEQIQEEATRFIHLAQDIYNDFNFEDISIVLSTRPAIHVGTEEMWNKAEKALEDTLKQNHIPWKLAPGDGAFYGPKIGFEMKDCLGRSWGCGTLQLDFFMPERLGASYVAQDNTHKVPVMLHRAILGSLERFIGIIIEHYAGILPLWLAPVQTSILTITDKQAVFANEIHQKLQIAGLRTKIDLRNEKIGFKIREHTLQRVPFLLIIGEREASTQTISVRTLHGKDLGSMTTDAFCQLLLETVASKN